MNKKQIFTEIQEFCVRCAPDQIVDNCSDSVCQFFKWKKSRDALSQEFGKKIVHFGKIPSKGKLLKAIRIKCLDCCGESSLEVANCPSRTCNLWPFRRGKEPERAESLVDDVFKDLFDTEPVDQVLNDMFDED